MKKERLRLKKMYKRRIHDTIKQGLKEDKYAILMCNFEIWDVFYRKESSVSRNRRVNFYANCIVDHIEQQVPLKVVCSVAKSIPRDASYYAGCGWSMGTVYAMALKGCNKSGKHFRSILQDYDYLCGVSQGSGPYDPYKSTSYQYVLDTLLKLVNTYDLLCVSDSGYFWRPDWLRKVARSNGLSYLPTVKIK